MIFGIGGGFMRKKILVIIIVLTSIFIEGCSLFPFLTLTSSYTTLFTPVTNSDTITFYDDEYLGYDDFYTPTYDITDADLYNDVLINTRDLIRRSNIAISATFYSQQLDPFGVPRTTVIDSSFGSGVIVSVDENYFYAITNFHVVNNKGNEPFYWITTFQDSYGSEGHVVGFDEELDLAIIKFERNNRENIHLMDYHTRLGFKMNEDELVLAVGNPKGLTHNVTFGRLHYMTSIDDVDYKVIYHSATIATGSSGGALVDVDGHLLGINAWGELNTDEEAFAIPVYIIYTFLANNGFQ
jgi:S1-C subfamily serine protease